MNSDTAREHDQFCAGWEDCHCFPEYDWVWQKTRAERAERRADDYEGRYETAHASRMHAEECYRREKVRADRAEAARQRISERAANDVLAMQVAMGDLLADVEEKVEKWRYKGEFGWGPWRAGEGPDPEGHVLDEVASELRALLDKHRSGS